MLIKPAYYNEIDKFAAQTLRNLIAAGHIAPGDVDERSIEDVHPDDLKPYTQCHFFAGVGVWSYALRAAGWPDDRSVWTGSCPCQPFSQAGQGSAFDDERHLWPAFHHLISECRPAAIYGEQVASKDADPWLDLVHTDMEALGYAFGAVAFPSAGVGAPHIRDRTYWIAVRGAGRRLGAGGAAVGLAYTQHSGREIGQPPRAGASAALSSGAAVRLANSHQHGRAALSLDRGHDQEHHLEPCSQLGGLAHASGTRPQRRESAGERSGAQLQTAERSGATCGLDNPERLGLDQIGEGDNGGNDGQLPGPAMQGSAGPGPVNGLWRAADWLLCRDGKWRPVEPGTFPLAHGAAARVGRLRAYGNAINAQAAQTFIEVTQDLI
ncbi:DNA cytosine methyltransferase [Comamonas koreensis]|uniref:DNA cytosine methyltransferase n=1 Tax=Comamonas koreensis TaxID=160825 RepID=A0AAW4Y196_9BURK|nr:DNA cytosine methyltransferase [Comamonas koreensis]MCD2166849.1 DNA cytosine methyltransferase [Comamonas koreensis]